MAEKNYQIEDSVVEQILASISTMHEAACYLLGQCPRSDQMFDDMTDGLYEMSSKMIALLEKNLGAAYEDLSLTKILKSVKITISQLQMRKKEESYQLSKIQFELIPLIEESFQHARYWLWAAKTPERMKRYFEEVPSLCGNYYIDQAEETGEYPYEAAFVVVGYNKLDYTKMCVESLLRNIPDGLNYELVLVNHGSSDGTQEYFESIHPTKQLNIAVNGAGYDIVRRIIESRFTFLITNDVVIGPHAIENMLTCIQSDEKIAWVVATTPNVSNFQAIPAQYSSWEEFEAFAAHNNRSAPSRWEQRTRLCDPIAVWRSAAFFGSGGIFDNSYLRAASDLAFPDDRRSVLLRRNGYKMMLAKDAYCHHFGSVTIKDEIAQKAEADFYMNGRHTFFQTFGIDPWGTGFCFDPIFLECVVEETHSHTEILGINCGLGGNSLKLKEQLKEYWQNTDTRLYNITDDQAVVSDLAGISDEARLVSNMKELQAYLGEKKFHYIIWELPFLSAYKFETVLECCWNALASDGKMFLKANASCKKVVSKKCKAYKLLKNNWISVNKR